MARRRQKNRQSISLFPFLSILACVIGTLTLMITALALGQMDTEEVATLDRYEMAQKRLAQLQEGIQKLQARIAALQETASEDRKQLAECQARLAVVLQQKEELLAKVDQPDEIDRDVPVVDREAHQKRMEALTQELQERQQRKAELAAQVEAGGERPTEAEVQIRPSGSGVDLVPAFVECAENGIVIHQGATPTRVRRADLASDSTFVALLERVAATPNASVIFLIRQDGLATYRAASSVASQHYARQGKLPVIGNGKIDLSLFRGE